MALDFVTMAEEHLADAAELLATRHREDRAVAPLLPARFENPANAAEVLHGLLAEDGMRCAAHRWPAFSAAHQSCTQRIMCLRASCSHDPPRSLMPDTPWRQTCHQISCGACTATWPRLGRHAG